MVVKQVLEGGLYASYTCIRGAHMLVIQVLEGLICSLHKY
jgi:hypothetical protein